MKDNLIPTGKVPTREEIVRLQSEMAKLPQADLRTQHYFADGMYCRELFRAAGTLIVGKVHKAEHFFIITKGRMIVWTDKGMVECGAGTILVSKPGTKRVTLSTEDSIGITVHRTDLKDLDAIEAELIEPDTEALFDAGNLLRALP